MPNGIPDWFYYSFTCLHCINCKQVCYCCEFLKKAWKEKQNEQNKTTV